MARAVPTSRFGAGGRYSSDGAVATIYGGTPAQRRPLVGDLLDVLCADHKWRIPMDASGEEHHCEVEDTLLLHLVDAAVWCAYIIEHRRPPIPERRDWEMSSARELAHSWHNPGWIAVHRALEGLPRALQVGPLLGILTTAMICEDEDDDEPLHKSVLRVADDPDHAQAGKNLQDQINLNMGKAQNFMKATLGGRGPCVLTVVELGLDDVLDDVPKMGQLRTQLFNNMRMRKEFSDLRGYYWQLDYSFVKGYYITMLIVAHGDEDTGRALRVALAKYWCEKITEGAGRAFAQNPQMRTVRPLQVVLERPSVAAIRALTEAFFRRMLSRKAFLCIRLDPGTQARSWHLAREAR